MQRKDSSATSEKVKYFTQNDYEELSKRKNSKTYPIHIHLPVNVDDSKKITEIEQSQPFRHIDTDDLMHLNKYVLVKYHQKKADRFEVLSLTKLRKILVETENQKGNIFDKATQLLIQIAKEHAFASGNRRTALFSALYFLLINDENYAIRDNPENSETLLGIRYDFYTFEEIKRWITHGEIKKYQRKHGKK
jgi:death-on-curing family protein